MTLTKPIVLIGMMGAGKTAIGKAVARIVDAQFVDSDDELVQAANMSIAEIFARDGETFFRRRETEVISRLISGVPQVIATGGGAYMGEDNRALIARHATSVWLKADLDLLWARVRHKTTRPLLQTDDPFGTLKTLYEQREHIYALADIHVTSRPDYSIDDMAHKVIAALCDGGQVSCTKDAKADI